MSAAAAPAPPPPVTTAEPATPTVSAGISLPGIGTIGAFGGIFAFIFALGAAYLSYKTYGSYPWATLDFFFPYIYDPYYAFFLASSPPPPPATMFGGKKSIMNLLKMKW